MIDDTVLIRIEQIKKRYGRRTVLTIPHLDIQTHDRILLVGPNGCGKSTLLRILAGISTISEGRIERSPALRSMRIGFVPQSGGLYEDMSLRQNLTIFRWLYGVGIDNAAANDFVDETGLSSLADIPVGELSGGLQQLASVACVLATEPHGLLMDEPTSDLDRDHAVYLTSKLSDLSRKLQFLIVATHQLSGFEFLQRHIFMTEGEIK